MITGTGKRVGIQGRHTGVKRNRAPSAPAQSLPWLRRHTVVLYSACLERAPERRELGSNARENLGEHPGHVLAERGGAYRRGAQPSSGYPRLDAEQFTRPRPAVPLVLVRVDPHLSDDDVSVLHDYAIADQPIG